MSTTFDHAHADHQHQYTDDAAAGQAADFDHEDNDGAAAEEEAASGENHDSFPPLTQEEEAAFLSWAQAHQQGFVPNADQEDEEEEEEEAQQEQQQQQSDVDGEQIKTPQFHEEEKQQFPPSTHHSRQPSHQPSHQPSQQGSHRSVKSNRSQQPPLPQSVAASHRSQQPQQQGSVHGSQRGVPQSHRSAASHYSSPHDEPDLDHSADEDDPRSSDGGHGGSGGAPYTPYTDATGSRPATRTTQGSAGWDSRYAQQLQQSDSSRTSGGASFDARLPMYAAGSSRHTKALEADMRRRQRRGEPLQPIEGAGGMDAATKYATSSHQPLEIKDRRWLAAQHDIAAANAMLLGRLLAIGHGSKSYYDASHGQKPEGAGELRRKFTWNDHFTADVVKERQAIMKYSNSYQRHRKNLLIEQENLRIQERLRKTRHTRGFDKKKMAKEWAEHERYRNLRSHFRSTDTPLGGGAGTGSSRTQKTDRDVMLALLTPAERAAREAQDLRDGLLPFPDTLNEQLKERDLPHSHIRYSSRQKRSLYNSFSQPNLAGGTLRGDVDQAARRTKELLMASRGGGAAFAQEGEFSRRAPAAGGVSRGDLGSAESGEFGSSQEMKYENGSFHDEDEEQHRTGLSEDEAAAFDTHGQYPLLGTDRTDMYGRRPFSHQQQAPPTGSSMQRSRSSGEILAANGRAQALTPAGIQQLMEHVFFHNPVAVASSAKQAQRQQQAQIRLKPLRRGGSSEKAAALRQMATSATQPTLSSSMLHNMRHPSMSPSSTGSLLTNTHDFRSGPVKHPLVEVKVRKGMRKEEAESTTSSKPGTSGSSRPLATSAPAPAPTAESAYEDEFEQNARALGMEQELAAEEEARARRQGSATSGSKQAETDVAVKEAEAIAAAKAAKKTAKAARLAALSTPKETASPSPATASGGSSPAPTKQSSVTGGGGGGSASKTPVTPVKKEHSRQASNTSQSGGQHARQPSNSTASQAAAAVASATEPAAQAADEVDPAAASDATAAEDESSAHARELQTEKQLDQALKDQQQHAVEKQWQASSSKQEDESHILSLEKQAEVDEKIKTADEEAKTAAITTASPSATAPSPSVRPLHKRLPSTFAVPRSEMQDLDTEEDPAGEEEDVLDPTACKTTPLNVQALSQFMRPVNTSRVVHPDEDSEETTPAA